MEKISQQTTSTNCGASRLDLVCQYQLTKKSSQVSFLSIDNKSGAISINPELSFSTKNSVQLVSSCNGWLLLTSKNKNQLSYHVFNPLTNETSSLPQPCIGSRVVVRSGLASSASEKNNHFQVVLVHASSSLELEIFSSETGKWKRHTPTNLLLPLPVKHLFPEPTVPPLYSNGAIHWEVFGHLLVYNVQNGHLELITLPNVSDDRRNQSTKVFQRCLWESEGRVHYCYNDVEGIHTWYLLNDQDLEYHSRYNNIDGEKFKWALAESLNHQTLMKNHPKIFQGWNKWKLHYLIFQGWNKWKPQNLAPFAYNESSQTMYMRLPGLVVSYNTKTRAVDEVFTFGVPGKDDDCSFFPFVYGGYHGNLHYVGKPSEAKLKVELPLKEVVSSLSF